MITVLRGGTVIDGVAAEPIHDGAIVIEGRRIKAVTTSSKLPSVPEDSAVIDVKGKTVLPGLMDMHTHLCIPSTSWDPGSEDPPVTELSIAITSMYAVENARNFIAKGITTIRDVGSQHHGIFAVQRLIESGQIIGPRMMACGRAIAMTGGHGMIVSHVADGVDGVRKQARTELKAGAACLKLMASGAGAESRQSPWSVELTQAELHAAVEEANNRGKTTCAHSMNPASTRNAVLAGINSIEHGVLLDEASLHLMKEHDVHYVPTIWTYQNTAENGQLYGTEDWMVLEVRKRVETHLAMVARAHELGVWISAGTDSGTPLNLKESLFWELEWMTYCGLTPMEAIRAATYNNAKLIKQTHSLGTLEPEKLADVLVVDGDPLANIKNLTRTDTVIKDGIVFVRSGKLLQSEAVKDLRRVPPGPMPPPSYLPEGRAPRIRSREEIREVEWSTSR